VNEFCKVFQQKSGNEWGQRFEKKPKKYQLLQLQVKSGQKGRRSLISAELDCRRHAQLYGTSQLPKAVLDVLEHFTNGKIIRSALSALAVT